jgi:uncharacterized protein with FMN-binding domain
VVGATIAGLAAILSFHTKSLPLNLGTLPAVAVPPDPSTSSVMSGTTPAAPATTDPPTTAVSTSEAPPTANPPTTASTTTAPATTNPPTTVASTTAAPATNPPTTATSTTPAPATTNPPTTVLPPTKTATGAAVNYGYGVLSVSATVSGTKLTDVAIASINDGGNFRSESIDQQAVPILEQEALQAQSASIQGVSGASYTSAGFQQSLQSALSQLGFR